MIHNYTSNISREQFELIREDLENARKRTRPRTVDLYEEYSAVYCTCSQQAANGVICQVTFQTGKPCMPTIKFGGK